MENTMGSSKVWLNKKPESSLDWLLIIFCSIAFYLVVGHLNVFWGGAAKILNVLSPFAGGIVLAYILDFIVRWFSKVVLKNNPKLRWLSILAAYVVFVAILVVLGALVIPQVVSSITMLFNNMPTYMENVQKWLQFLQERTGADLSRVTEALNNYQKIITNFSGTASDMVPQIVSYLGSIATNVVSVFTAVAGSIYMLAEKEKLLRQLRTMTHAFLPENVANNTLRICAIANENFSGFFSGKIIDSAIIGVITFVAMQVLGMSFVPLISVVVGVTNIIPVFGPFIGAIPGLLILLIVDPLQALEFLVLIICIQQLDGNFIGPKILGHSIGISALFGGIWNPLANMIIAINRQFEFSVAYMAISVLAIGLIYLTGRELGSTSAALAIAVFSRQAAAPISIASQACDGLPMPASTITGNAISSIRMRISSLVCRPRFVPIGAPSGITAAAPALTSALATIRSGLT